MEALSAGTINPQIPSNEAAHNDLSRLDLPPPFGPVNRNSDFMSTVLQTAFPCAESNQYGANPFINNPSVDALVSLRWHQIKEKKNNNLE